MRAGKVVVAICAVLVAGCGQTDTPALERSDVFVPVVVPEGVTAIAAGSDHNLALTGDGQVWAWGDNSEEQLGVGDTDTCGPVVNPIGACRRAPATVPGLQDIAAIAAGTDHGVAVNRDGQVWGWGDNRYGQAGPDIPERNCDRRDDPCQPQPTVIPGLDGITALAAGPAHSVALDRDGAVWVWGLAPQAGPDGGEVCGEGTLIYPCRTVPSRIAELPPIDQIAAAWNHTLAVDRDGRIWAWGVNDYGQVGNGTLTESATPVLVEIPVGAAAIDPGDQHSQVLGRDGSVWVWGGLPNIDGSACGFQLEESCAVTPLQALPPGSASALVPGGSTLVVTAGGGLQSWSSEGAFAPDSMPAGLVGLQHGHQHSLALTGSGGVLAQGWNGLGQLGQ
jgi:alpha-tubulin suppressor-like RCC1 family protein